MSPCLPQPKQCQVSRTGVTTNEGVFSPWNGHSPLRVVPAFFSWTVSPTTSATGSRPLISATAPTAKGHPFRFRRRATGPSRKWLGTCQVLTGHLRARVPPVVGLDKKRLSSPGDPSDTPIQHARDVISVPSGQLGEDVL